MIPVLTVLNGETPTPISNDENICVKVIQGLTLADAIINTSQRINGKGAMIVSVGVRPRNIVIKLCPENDVFQGRRLIYDSFVVGEQVELELTTDFAVVTIDGVVESVQGDLFENRQTMQISVICPFPFFKNASEKLENEIQPGTSTLAEGQPFSAGCEITITSIERFDSVMISVNGEGNRYQHCSVDLNESVSALTIKSYDDDREIVGHPIECFGCNSDWISLFRGNNNVLISLYKKTSGELVEFSQAEYDQTTAVISEPIYYGGI